MDYKILQIIPNNKNIKAKYEDSNGCFKLPIVCFALVEWADGDRTIEPMDITSDGKVDLLYTATITFE